MKKTLTLILAVCLLLTLLPAHMAFAQGEKVTIRFAPGWSADTRGDLKRSIVEKFCEENPDINLVLEEISGDEMKNKIRVDVAGNNEPDVWQFWPGCTCNEYAEAGILADISDYLSKTDAIKEEYFSPAVWETCSYKGTKVALPICGAYSVMMINKPLFEQFGLEAPTNYDELLEVGKVFAANGITTLNVGSKGGNPSHFLFNALVCEYEQGVQDTFNMADPALMTYKTDAMINAARKIEEMRDLGLFAKDTLGQTGDWSPSIAYYDEGMSAMCYTLSWCFQSVSPETLAISEIIPFPGFVDSDRTVNHAQGTTNDCFCVSAKAWNDPKKQDAIRRLLDCLMADMTPAVVQAGLEVPLNSKTIAEMDTDAMEDRLMVEVMNWNQEHDIQADPMIWTYTPTQSMLQDYCGALDELFAGAINADEFIEKCETSALEYLEDLDI